MTDDKIITRKIARKLSASVISAQAGTDLGQPLWAINWFDLKRKWIYDLYNRLVYGHVRKIGAKPIFKGHLIRPLVDNERLRRDMLLIVKYPKSSAFLEMISSKLFQLKGLLRTSSVRHFQFGFMQYDSHCNEPKAARTKYNGQLKYLVHVCEGNKSVDVRSLLDFAIEKEVFPHFIGQRSAMLGLQKEQKGLRTLDFMLNHVFVFSGFDHDALESLVQSKYYQDFIHNSPSNFIGIYDRTI